MGDDISLSAADVRDLRRLAGIMIPADAAYGVPAADDPVIFGDILSSIGRDLADVKAGLAALAAGGFGDLDEADAERLAHAVLATPGRVAAALSRVVLQCYYRDERVLRSLGHDPRAPYPRGNVLEQGDWSLLDVVKTRPRLWRDDRGM